MDKSICFCYDEIEKINKYIQVEIDKRLYLFSNYCPKKPPKTMIAKYIYAITNLYGLYFDCAKYFVRGQNNQNSMIESLKDYNCLSLDDYNHFKEYINIISSLRMLYTHNSTMEEAITRNHMDYVLVYYKSLLSIKIDKEIENIGDLHITDTSYNLLLTDIITKTDNCLGIIVKTLKKVACHKDKSQIVLLWLEKIALWYGVKEEFFRNSLIDWYNYQNTNQDLFEYSAKTIQWVNYTMKKTKSTLPQLIDQQMATISQTVYPQVLFWRLLDQLNPEVF